MKTEKPDVSLKYKDKNGDGQKEWHMQAGTGKPEKGPGAYDKLVIGQGDNGIFTFEIKTPGITFDPNNPIDFRLESGGTDMSDQFIEKIVDGKLIVADPNSDQVLTEYYYQLNFVGATPLDPIIQNGCCNTRIGGTETGTGGTQLMSLTGAISVLLVAAVLAALFIAFTRRAK